MRTNTVPVVQVPYFDQDFDDINVNAVQAALEGLTSEVGTRPKVAPVS